MNMLDLFKAAVYGKLPAGFNYWELVDNNGFTMFQVADAYGNLPKNINAASLNGFRKVTKSDIHAVYDKLAYRYARETMHTTV